MTNGVDPDQTPRSAASDLGLFGLLRSVCPKVRVITVGFIDLLLFQGNIILIIQYH